MAVKLKMKKNILLTLIICVASFYLQAQTTKPATTTTTKKTTTTAVKKAPVKTTTTVKKTTTTVAKPVATTPSPPPVVKQAEVTPPPTEVVKEPTGPPVTGAIGSGPKSYEPDKKTTTTSATKTTTKTTAKTVAPKTDVKKKNYDERTRSYIGIRGGYNLATVDGLEVDAGVGVPIKNTAGYMGGIVLNLGLSKALSIQPEILYSQQGVQVGEGDTYVKGKVDIVNVPLLIKVALGSPKIKFFVNAGPYIGYKISQSSEISLGGSITKEKEDFVKDYDINGTKDNMFDFGAIGGAGLQFSLGGPLLVLEGRYQYGMADPLLYKDGKPSNVGKTYGHHRVMTGTIGLLFPLGGR